MNKIITWDKVLTRNFVGGYVELVNKGVRYFGPISSIIAHEEEIKVSVLWLAQSDKTIWRKVVDSQVITFTRANQPQDIGRNQVHIPISVKAQYTFHPKGGVRFASLRVEGV